MRRRCARRCARWSSWRVWSAWGWSRSTGRGLPASSEAPGAGQLERTVFRPYDGGAGRVQALDLRRARTRRFQAVFVLGLEEGGLPGPARENPFLSGEEAGALGVSRLDPLERDRHLFYTAVTRPR